MPVINLFISYTLDGRLTEGNTYLERSALGVSLDSGLTEGASGLDPLEQLVLGSSLAARPIEGIKMKVSDWKPVIKPVQNSTPDDQPMEGLLTWSIRLWGCLWTVDSWKGCRVRNHWSNQCSERCRSYNRRRQICQSIRLWHHRRTTNRHVLNCRRGRCWIP